MIWKGAISYGWSILNCVTPVPLHRSSYFALGVSVNGTRRPPRLFTRIPSHNAAEKKAIREKEDGNV